MNRGQPYYPDAIAPIHPKQLYCLHDAGVISDAGIVYDARTGIVVRETAMSWQRTPWQHQVFETLHWQAPVRIPGLVLNLSTLSASSFYHFLFDALPRLHLAQPWRGKIEAYLCPGRPGDYHDRWLQAANVPPDKIIWMQPTSHYACDCLLFSPPLMRMFQPTPWFTQVLQKLFPAPPTDSTPSRILISRRSAYDRSIKWEDQLLRQLEGFDLIDAAAMSPAEQINIMSNCAALVGPHGAGLSLVALARRPGFLIELFQNKYYYPLYERLGQAAGWQTAWAAVDFNHEPRISELVQRVVSFSDSRSACPAL